MDCEMGTLETAVADLDLSWLKDVITEARRRGKKKGKNGRPRLDKEYLMAETDRRLNKKSEAV